MLRLELIRPIPRLLAERAECFGDKIAFCDGRRTLTYAELDRRTARLAGHLLRLGLAHGDRVLIYMDDRAETAESCLATTRCSAVGVCVNPHAALPEIAYMLDDSGARGSHRRGARRPRARPPRRAVRGGRRSRAGRR
jgi:rifamycin polyketide synthase module 1/2/3